MLSFYSPFVAPGVAPLMTLAPEDKPSVSRDGGEITPILAADP